MKNAKTTSIGNGFVRITPNKGYMLYHAKTNKYYSEAETDHEADFTAKKNK